MMAAELASTEIKSGWQHEEPQLIMNADKIISRLCIVFIFITINLTTIIVLLLNHLILVILHGSCNFLKGFPIDHFSVG